MNLYLKKKNVFVRLHDVLLPISHYILQAHIQLNIKLFVSI